MPLNMHINCLRSVQPTKICIQFIIHTYTHMIACVVCTCVCTNTICPYVWLVNCISLFCRRYELFTFLVEFMPLVCTHTHTHIQAYCMHKYNNTVINMQQQLFMWVHIYFSELQWFCTSTIEFILCKCVCVRVREYACNCMLIFYRHNYIKYSMPK